jgi:hypothetical protein
VDAEGRKYKLPYAVLAGRDSKVADAYKLGSLPYLVIVDSGGAAALSVRFAKKEEIRKVVEDLLKQSASAHPF